jgi:prolyl-tRNA synthetase
VGPKGLAEDQIEIKTRATGEREVLTLEGVIARFAGA